MGIEYTGQERSIYLKFESCSSVGYCGGGLDCSHCKVELHSLQINFTSAQLQLLGGGGSDCSHCKVELHSLQINFTSAKLQLLEGGSDCSHCKVELHSLQINFTSAQLQLSAVQLCTDCSLTPSPESKWKLGCSECSSTLQ